MPTENLEIKLMERRDRTRFLEVRLASSIRPGVIATTQVNDQGAEDRTGQAVLAAGGALAEYLGRSYGDSFNAGDIAREARELYRELMSDYRQGLH